MSDTTESNPKYKLVNIYEQQVFTLVRSMIDKDPDMCRCDKCFLDVCALVLNTGFTRYVTTAQGELLAMLANNGESRDVEMLVSTMNAIKMVKARPSHDVK